MTSKKIADAKLASPADSRSTRGSKDGSLTARCKRCSRPQSACYCALITPVDNRTEIVIVQHVRERDHPFNTARMAKRCLKNATLHSGAPARLAETEFGLRPDAGLLYPGQGSILLNDLSPDQVPSQLVVIDGTWHHAKTLVRDLPQLKSLRRFHLLPPAPGKYRIRLEPTATSLSTIEAIAAALNVLEPDANGLDSILRPFEQMIESQLNHPLVESNHYSAGPKSGQTTNVPSALLGDANRIVVAYAEASYRPDDAHQDLRTPLVWVAQRLGSGETVAFTLTPEVPLTSSFLQHLDLPRDHFAQTVSRQEFCQRWSQFVRPGDILVVYNQGTVDLLVAAGGLCPDHFTLKSICLGGTRPRPTLSQFVTGNELQVENRLPDFGRAGRRLANAVALVQYLRSPKVT